MPPMFLTFADDPLKNYTFSGKKLATNNMLPGMIAGKAGAIETTTRLYQCHLSSKSRRTSGAPSPPPTPLTRYGSYEIRHRILSISTALWRPEELFQLVNLFSRKSP